MRKVLITVLVLSFMAGTSAQAHQPVDLLATDTTAAKGPLLVDGTISFAVRAAFSKAGEKKGFRAAFAEGDGLSVEYLIVDKKPENTLRPTQLPTLVMTSPKGRSLTIKFTERTKFPYSGVNYLYLARYQAVAEAGEYSFLVTAKRKASIILSVGVKEIPGEVLRGPKPTPSVTPAPAPTPSAAASSTPAPTPAPTVTKVGYTMTQVRANNTATNCWAVIDGSVYDLTNWIKSHPGGSGAIVGLCGTDGSAAFSIKHGNQSRPAAQLNSYRLGPLEK
jgi:cytochrome b involved in lipid metabolism